MSELGNPQKLAKLISCVLPRPPDRAETMLFLMQASLLPECTPPRRWLTARTHPCLSMREIATKVPYPRALLAQGASILEYQNCAVRLRGRGCRVDCQLGVSVADPACCDAADDVEQLITVAEAETASR